MKPPFKEGEVALSRRGKASSVGENEDIVVLRFISLGF